MNILLQFNTKSTSHRTKDAIILANKLNGYTCPHDKKLMIVEVDSFNKTFIKLFKIVIKEFIKITVTVDGELIDDPWWLFDILTCNKRCTREGICTLSDGWNHILFHVGVIAKPKSYDYIYDLPEFKFKDIDDPRLIIKDEGKTIVANRDILIENFMMAFSYQSKFCPKYDNSAILEKLRGLDEEIAIDSGRSEWICIPSKDLSEEEPDPQYLGFHIVKK